MNYFIAALKKYAVFTGRSRRKEYWFFSLFVILTFMVLGGLMQLSSVFGIVYLIAWLGTIVPSLAVAIRRMHDVNKSGWFILIPIYNLILALTPGDAGTNQYGPDPKRPEFEEFLSDKPGAAPSI